MSPSIPPATWFLGLLGIAAAFVIVRATCLARGLGGPRVCYQLSTPIELASWDFSNSWASNLATIGALLGTVLSTSFPLSDHPTLSKQDYAGLALFFGALVVLAAFFYNGTRSLTTLEQGGTVDDEYQGSVLTFLMASCLTLWAVLGELTTLWLLLNDMRSSTTAGPPFSAWIFVPLFMMLAASFLILALYVWRTIGGTIYWAIEDKHAAAAAAPDNGSAAPAPESTAISAEAHALIHRASVPQATRRRRRALL